MLGPSSRGPLVSYELSEVCKPYNECRCHYQLCKFKYVCRACKEITQQQQNQTAMRRSWAGVPQVQCAKVEASGAGSRVSHISQWGTAQTICSYTDSIMEYIDLLYVVTLF